MDEHHVHAFVAGVHHCPLEQPCAKSTATGLLEHGHAELGAVFVLRVLREGQMGHRYELKAAVVNTKDLVAVEIKLLRVAANLLVVGCIAKAQITVRRLQLQQVLRDAFAVRGAKGANGDHHRVGVAAAALNRRATRCWAQHGFADVPGSLQPVFGCDHGTKYKGFPQSFPVQIAALQQNKRAQSKYE
ncbi:hypothetical protein D3C71_1626360 [compost metagenome]